VESAPASGAPTSTHTRSRVAVETKKQVVKSGVKQQLVAEMHRLLFGVSNQRRRASSEIIKFFEGASFFSLRFLISAAGYPIQNLGGADIE
jgi:hypothetical protein